jgi:hypothetical protein
VVPADATRFSVRDPDIARTLDVPGAQLVEHDPDVEIGQADELSGTAPLAVVSVDASAAEKGPRVVRAGRRVAASAGARLHSERVRRELRRRGYRHVALFPWDRDQVMRLPGALRPPQLALADRFPCRVVVVGRRGLREETAFERAVSEGGALAGLRLHPTWPFPRAGGLVALCNGSVLRVATGAGGHHVQAQRNALEALSAARPPAAVTVRVPQLLGDGRLGITRWSLEVRVAGVPAPHSLDSSLLDSCVDFLRALHGLGDCLAADEDVGRLSAHGRIVERVLPLDRRGALHELTRATESRLVEVARVFGHGDFCTSNLLVQGRQLTGVVDWEAASANSLPVVDLLHFHLLEVRRPNVYEWGTAIVDYLLPLMQRGGDTVIQSYLERVGLDLDPRTLEAMVTAYWLGRVSSQVGTYVERNRDPVWIERNIVRVLDALSGM